MSGIHSGRFEAIGVVNQVTVIDADALEPALEIARAEVAALDDACSRFRDDSELALVNRSAGRPVVVSKLFIEAVEIALRAAEATAGLVDPTVGGALRGLGYDQDFTLVVSRGPSPRFIPVPATGWRSVRVDRAAATVELRAGTELDLGATAKAFGSDRIAARVHAETGVDVLVSLGGDIAVAGAPPSGWTVRVTDDHRRPDGAGQSVAIHDGGLATSSTTVRRWRAGDVDMHHIVDPSTGLPAPENWRTVSVAGASCVDANTAATAAILLGDAAVPWLEERRLAARLVAPDGTVVRTGGWPDE
jgi:thiamine biosynthesis lipoprotein